MSYATILEARRTSGGAYKATALSVTMRVDYCVHEQTCFTFMSPDADGRQAEVGHEFIPWLESASACSTVAFRSSISLVRRVLCNLAV